MDATLLLKQDHEKLKGLFDAYADGAPEAFRRRLVRDIGAALRTHVRLEETVFYPVVMRVRSEEAKLSVRDALEDHHVLDGLVAELEQLEPEDVEFDAKVRSLRLGLERHIADVEQRMFAEVRIHLTDERLERLGREMAALREGRPVRRAPRGPAAPLRGAARMRDRSPR